MNEQPTKGHNNPPGTLGTFQRKGELVKPAELIEVRGGENITLSARRIYNQLLSNAFGPDMAAEGATFEIDISVLRGNYSRNDRVKDDVLSLMQTTVVVRLTDGSEQNVQMLGPTRFSKPVRGVMTKMTYRFNDEMLPILRDSQIFARLEMQILHGFTTKYGMALYELTAKRVRHKHLFYEDIDVELLRSYLGVPEGKLGPYGALRRKAIEPAVEEVNALAPFSCSLEPIETHGRKIVKLRLSWWWKSIEEQKAQWAVDRGLDQDFDIMEQEISA